MTSKYHEHHALERQVAFLTIVTGGFGLLAIVVGCMDLPRRDGWWLLLAGTCMSGLAVGLWYAQEWARILVGVLSLGALAFVVVGQGWEHAATALHLKGAVFTYGSYLLLPSTRHVFARAREARQRESEAIREAGPNRRRLQRRASARSENSTP